MVRSACQFNMLFSEDDKHAALPPDQSPNRRSAALMGTSRPSWSVVAPFFRGEGDRWIDDFVPDGRWTFSKVSLSARDDWHSRARRATGAEKWLQYWNQAG